MKNRRQQQYRRQKLAGQAVKLFWSALCLAVALILVGLAIRWLIPWGRHLWETL